MAQTKYCTIDQLCGSSSLSGYLPDMTDGKNRTKAEQVIERISAMIDDYVSLTRRKNVFAPSPEIAASKRIRGGGYSFLKMPEFVAESVTKLEIENAGVLTEIGSIYWEIEENKLILVDEYGTKRRDMIWTKGRPYTVTARWGYSEIPLPITEACLNWCVDVIRRADGNFGGVLSGIASNPVPITNLYVGGSNKLPPNVLTVLDGYRKAFDRQFNLIA